MTDLNREPVSGLAKITYLDVDEGGGEESVRAAAAVEVRRLGGIVCSAYKPTAFRTVALCSARSASIEGWDDATKQQPAVARGVVYDLRIHLVMAYYTCMLNWTHNFRCELSKFHLDEIHNSFPLSVHNSNGVTTYF